MSADQSREARAHAREIKFLLSTALAVEVREWARSRLTADPHGHGPCGDEYDTTTIYFDTTARDVFHGRGSYGRSKYRVRRYGSASAVFLERKLRRPRLLTKRRTTIGVDDLALLAREAPREWEGDWFLQRLRVRGLRPVCRIGYHRVARAALTGSGAARLTLDERLHAGHTDGVDFDNGSTMVPILEGHSVLELKFHRDIPALFKALIAEFRLEPRALSKYRTAMGVLEPLAPAAPPKPGSPIAPEAAEGLNETDAPCG